MADHISFSELETFQRCKRLWWYTYEQGWVPRREAEPLRRGAWMHALLAAHYLGADWRGEHAARRAALLETALFEEEREVLRAEADLIEAVMARYVEHYATDAWEVVSYEGVPLVEREIVVALPWPLKIRVDLVARDPDGLIWVWDHKTKYDFDRNLEAETDHDPQLSIYTLGLRALGLPIAGGIYNYIRMRLPAEPRINKDGSLSRAPIVTDELTVRRFVARAGVRVSEAELEDYIARLPKDAFFRRYFTVRTDEELAATAEEIEAKLNERALVRERGLVTRTLIRECVRCPFYRPCLIALKGGDEAAILSESYHRPGKETTPQISDWEGGEVA